MPPPPTPAVSDGERAVLLELRQRRQELDARDTALAAREATLAAAELRLTARVGELQSLQHKLEELEQTRQQREDTSWQGLVKLYESMKPRDAATIFNELDMQVLLGVVDRMKDAKAAPVLAAMQPDKARELTTKLAALRTKRAAVAQAN
jgi:flagellar motility protein MotE (MotC chaperone)